MDLLRNAIFHRVGEPTAAGNLSHDLRTHRIPPVVKSHVILRGKKNS